MCFKKSVVKITILSLLARLANQASYITPPGTGSLDRKSCEAWGDGWWWCVGGALCWQHIYILGGGVAYEGVSRTIRQKYVVFFFLGYLLQMFARAIDPELVWQMLVDHIDGNILFTPLTLCAEGLHAGGTWNFTHTHPPFNACPYISLQSVVTFSLQWCFHCCRNLC